MNKPVYLRLTLCVRSCYLENLERCKDMLLSGLEKLKQYTRIKNTFEFCFCYLDVVKDYGTIRHPHLHCFVKAKPGYYNTVSERILRPLWRKCCDLDYDPVVDITRIEGFFIAEQEDKQ